MTSIDRGGDIDELMAIHFQHLRHNKHEVVLFHVLDDATEMKFNFQDRPTIFPKTARNGRRAATLHPAEVREAYKTRMAQLRKDLDVRCAQYRI